MPAITDIATQPLVGFIGGIGTTELLVILVVALIVLGPTKLPQVARSIGKGLRELRRATDDLKDGLYEDVDDVRQTLKEARDGVLSEPASWEKTKPPASAAAPETPAPVAAPETPPTLTEIEPELPEPVAPPSVAAPAESVEVTTSRPSPPPPAAVPLPVDDEDKA